MYRHQGRDRWVVLQRGEASSLIYCKVCRCEWRSSRKYVADLPDWRKRKRGTVTDDEILHRLFVDGDLRIDSESSVVESCRTGRGGKGEWKIISQVADSHDSGYRFVAINYKGRQRKIAVHVLQWMAANRRSVPDDHDVDHIVRQQPPEEKNNAITNLRIVRSSLNKARQSDQLELF